MVWGSGFRRAFRTEVPAPVLAKGLARVYFFIQGLFGWFMVRGFGCRVEGVELRVWGIWVLIQGVGVWGLEFEPVEVELDHFGLVA